MTNNIDPDDFLPPEFQPRNLKKNQPVTMDNFHQELLQLMDFNISWTDVKPGDYAETIQKILQSNAQDWDNLLHSVVLIEVLDEEGGSFFDPLDATGEINNKIILVVTSESLYIIGFKPQGPNIDPSYELVCVSTSSDIQAVADTINYYPVDEGIY